MSGIITGRTLIAFRAVSHTVAFQKAFPGASALVNKLQLTCPWVWIDNGKIKVNQM